MDKFVGNLIEVINKLNEPTIIAFYDAHFPVVEIDASEVSINTLKCTTYLIWDNINLSETYKSINIYKLTSLI